MSTQRQLAQSAICSFASKWGFVTKEIFKMSASTTSTIDRSGRANGSCRTGRANWSGINIAAMVFGFVFFWPVGLFVLYWILTGREVLDLPAAMPSMLNRVKEVFGGSSNEDVKIQSGNSIFNDFQQTQHDRIREIKEENQNEFDAFMASAPEQGKG